MIISASYKTDIPTFYGEWFMNRLRAGYCKTVNPYNSRISRVSLERGVVEAFVFWTKNLGPFMGSLAEISSLQIPFVVQHTINNYPRSLETSVVDCNRTIEHVQAVSRTFGKNVCVWRYDPVLFTSLTPFEFHLDNFSDLSKRLSGYVNEVVISFAHAYSKTIQNMDDATAKFDFVWEDPPAKTKQETASALKFIAASRDIKLTICSQPEFSVAGAGVARCVDAERIARVGGFDIRANLRGNRKGCGCYESTDIGEYDTCSHGCVYCYAVRNPGLSLIRYKKHDPVSEFLFTPSQNILDNNLKRRGSQLGLFPDE